MYITKELKMKKRSNLINVTAFFESLALGIESFRPYKLIVTRPSVNGAVDFWARLIKADRFDARITERIQKWIH